MGKKLVCGDRDWDDTDTMAVEMAEWPSDTSVVHGGCTGADTLGGACAELLGMTVKVYPYIQGIGKAGGPKRNTLMLDDNPDLDEVVAFHNDIANSRGTKDMLRQAMARGVPCRLITSNGEVLVTEELCRR